MSLLYIYKLTDNYYQITIGDDGNYYDEAIKCVNLKYLLPDVKYLKDDRTMISCCVIPEDDDAKGKYVFKFNAKYDKYKICTIYSYLSSKYEKDKDVITFTNNLIKALKDLSTNNDFSVKRINELKKIEINESATKFGPTTIESTKFGPTTIESTITEITTNEIRIIQPTINKPIKPIKIKQYFNVCEEIEYVDSPKNILFIKSDLDIETIYNLVEYDCLSMRVSTKYHDYYIKDDDVCMKLKSKIKFNNEFKGLLDVYNIKMYIKTDEDKLIKLLSKLTNIKCENYKNCNDIIKSLEDIRLQSECMINKLQYKQMNEVKNKIKSKLENIDNIEILNEILKHIE